MKATTYTVPSTNPEVLDRVFDEYVFLGRNVKRVGKRVVLFPYPDKKRPVKAVRERRDEDAKPASGRPEQKSKREHWNE